MIKILWILIAINSIALLVFIGAYFVLSNGRNVDYQEKGWTFILSAVGLVVILLAALPLRYSQSTGTMIFSGLFAVLPLAIFAGVFINEKLEGLKKGKTFAETYYHDKTQRSIAAAIENNDTLLLKELIKGKDVNERGPKQWDDEDGLNYLQFAIRIRSRANDFPINDKANREAIHILTKNGCAPTPALAQAVQCLPPEEVALLLDAGADPNTRGFVDPNPLLFEVIDRNREQNDMTILLLQKGADVNKKHDNGFTPAMFAAFTAGTTARWSNMWQLVLYMLEDVHADYRYVSPKGMTINIIVQKIKTEAKENNITMPTDFDKVVKWLQVHHADEVNLSQK